mgnify:CR=1 FL=1
MLAMLAGCATSGTADLRRTLPPIPADLHACFGAATLVPRPAGSGPITADEIVRLVARLKLSEHVHDRCGLRLIAWYEALE